MIEVAHGADRDTVFQIQVEIAVSQWLANGHAVLLVAQVHHEYARHLVEQLVKPGGLGSFDGGPGKHSYSNRCIAAFDEFPFAGRDDHLISYCGFGLQQNQFSASSYSYISGGIANRADDEVSAVVRTFQGKLSQGVGGTTTGAILLRTMN